MYIQWGLTKPSGLSGSEWVGVGWSGLGGLSGLVPLRPTEPTQISHPRVI